MPRVVSLFLLLAGAAALAQEEPHSPALDLYPKGFIYEHLYEGPFTDPLGVAVDDAHKEVLVADTKGNRIGIFDLDGGPIFSFGGTNRVREPRKIVVDPRGRLLVLDADRSQVKVFNYRGDYQGPLPLEGVRKGASFTAIAVDRDGNVYVGEQESSQVWVFDASGKLKMRIGGHGEGQGTFSSVAGIAVDDQNIVVTDHQAAAVQVFDRRGHFLRGWGKHDMGRENFSLPEGVALDHKGRILVVDSLRHEIKFFDKEGHFLARFGGFGSLPGQVSFPTDVAVDARGKVYVVEKVGRRVQIFDVLEGS